MIKRFGALALTALALTACITGCDGKGPFPSPATSSPGATTTPPVTTVAPTNLPGTPTHAPTNLPESPTPAPTNLPGTPTPTNLPGTPTPAPVPGETGAGDWKSALAAALACPDGAGPVEQGPTVLRDLTGDGVPDVLVAAACTGSTSSWPAVVHAYDGAPPAGRWRRLGVLLTQDDGEDERGLRVKKILIENGTIMVTSRAYRVGDNNADGGSLTVTDRFTWTGAGFQRGERTIA